MTETHKEKITEQFSTLVRIYAENGDARISVAKPKKGYITLGLEFDPAHVSPEKRQEYFADIKKAMGVVAANDGPQVTDTKLTVDVADMPKTVSFFQNFIQDAYIDHASKAIAAARAEAQKQAQKLFPENMVEVIMHKIDQKTHPRPLTPEQIVASGPMEDWANGINAGDRGWYR